MKKNYIYIVFCLLLSFTSCNEWLDVELVNKVDEEKLFSKTEGFYEALAGVYSDMSKSTLYGENLTMEYMDLFAGYYSYENVSGEYDEFKNYAYQNNTVASTLSSIWRNMYHCISATNSILEWTDKNRDVLSETDRDQIRGEALALRAFLHFDLYRMFCPDVKRDPKVDGIPYNKIFGVSLPHVYTVEEVVQLVLNDLNEAEQHLVADPITIVKPYELGFSEEGLLEGRNLSDKYVARINLYTVKAIKARVYQARGENTKAVAMAKEIIESETFRLLEFSSIDKDEKETDMLFSDEHIFSLRNKDLKDYSKELHFNKVTESSTTFKPLAFAGVFSIYESNNDDARYVKWFNVGDFMKYTTDNSDVFFRKMPIIKLSEMYLIVAECSYGTSPEESLEYINILRDHRIRNNIHWTSLTKEYIFQEMTREYLGEGLMWYAYKRDNRAVPTNGSAGEFEPSNSMFVFPMPLDEIEDGNRN